MAIFGGYIAGVISSGFVVNVNSDTARKSNDQWMPKSTKVLNDQKMKENARLLRRKQVAIAMAHEERIKQIEEAKVRAAEERRIKREAEKKARDERRKKKKAADRKIVLEKFAKKQAQLKKSRLELKEEMTLLSIDDAELLKVNDWRKVSLNVKIPTAPTDNQILKWYYDTTVNDYLREGSHNSTWDQEAIDTLYLTALKFSENHYDNKEVVSTKKLYEQYSRLIDTLHCTSPIIQYGHYLVSLMVKEHEHSDTNLEQLLQLSQKIKKSGCSLFRKAHINHLVTANFHTERIESRTRRLKIVEFMVKDGFRFWPLLLKDKAIPESVLAALVIGQYPFTRALGATRSEENYQSTTMIANSKKYSLLSLIKEHRPDSLALKLIEAKELQMLGWGYRGTGYASSVSTSRFTGFRSCLEKAKQKYIEAYNRWPNFSYPSLQMISISMGLSLNTETMNMWFNRAIKANTTYSAPYNAKTLYLLPRWHGSKEECLTFVRDSLKKAENNIEIADVAEIVDTAHFYLSGREAKGKSRRILEYWKDPRVWNDFSRAYAVLNNKGQRNIREVKSLYLAHAILCKKINIAKEISKELKNRYNEKPFTKYGLVLESERFFWKRSAKKEVPAIYRK